MTANLNDDFSILSAESSFHLTYWLHSLNR